MPTRHKGKVHEAPLEDFLKSDSNDSDFDEASTRVRPSRPKSHSKKSKSKKSSRPKPPRRTNREYDSSSVVSDDQSIESDEPFTEDDLDDPPELNPRTGRPTRNTAKRTTATYAEPESNDDSNTDDSDDSDDNIDELQQPSPQKNNRQKASLIVTLTVAPEKLQAITMDTRSSRRLRGRSRSASVQPAAEGYHTRRSSRLSAEPETLLELGDNNKARVTTGGKSPMKAPAKTAGKVPAKTSGKVPAKTSGKVPAKAVKHPGVSVILEESEESFLPVAQADANDSDGEQQDNTTILVESIETPDEPANVEHLTDDEDEGPLIIPADDDDDEEGPVRRTSRTKTRKNDQTLSRKNSSQRGQKRKASDSEDEYDPDGDAGSLDEHNSEMENVAGTKRKRDDTDSEADVEAPSEEELDPNEIRAELHELARPRRSKRQRTANHTDSEIVYEQPRALRRRETQKPNYNLLPAGIFEEDAASDGGALRADRPITRNGGARGPQRSLFDMSGPFGGNVIGSTTLKYGPDAAAQRALVDDSSDDEGQVMPPNAHNIGVAPLTPHGQKGPAKKTNAADITPVEVPTDISLDSVGGLDDHINKLKEMVMLPLLYPELYSKWKIPPPRGVLFHGPPGTGKTLLARALASSVSTGEQKVTFYMRKGSDVMSKWVGEAERQLRLLFEEAKKNQPAIIFFDEFDGLAPLRSEKQEQTHVSIVSTLLALMDGMDNRGQVVVIGATNRPDNIDPAFRRPGRFDREFYFPLPGTDARRAILNIHTREWEPPLDPKFVNHLAVVCKGYGGADLRALCTEAVINATQRTYPQIYRSDKKLVVDTSKIRVTPKDFILAMRKITPSSNRQSGPLAEPLPEKVEPLLKRSLEEIVTRLDNVVPQKKQHLTALEEAEYDDPDNPVDFEQEELMRAMERARVFRPRLLIKGVRGMGQKYLSSAIMNRLDNFFVRSLDLATLFSDPAYTPEAMLSNAFKEVRSHQPSVLFIPQINTWYETVGVQVLATLSTLLRSIPATDAVLLLGVMECDDADEQPDPQMLKDLFGFSTKHEYEIRRPGKSERLHFFEPLMSYLRKRPSDFPDLENRKKRKLPELPVAEAQPKKAELTKEQLKAQAKADRSTINFLRLALAPMMKELKNPLWRLFRSSIVPDRDIDYLLQEQDPNVLTSNVGAEEQVRQGVARPYEIATDKYGNRGLKETSTGRFYYNLNVQVIEQRLSNGYYKRPKEFIWDIKTIMKDAATHGNPDTILKANNMYGFAMAEAELLEANNHILFQQCEGVYARERERAKLASQNRPAIQLNIGPAAPSTTIGTGPIRLGEPLPGVRPFTPNRGPNGDHAHTNGETVPSHGGLHINTTDPQASSGERVQFPTGFTETPSNQDTTAPGDRSQRSALEKMMPGSQAADYHNNASTTSSGLKTSDDSGPRVVDVGANSLQQASNGEGGATQPISKRGATFTAPDFTDYIPSADTGSQLPDTQSTESNGVHAPSHAHAELKARTSSGLGSVAATGESLQDSLGHGGVFKRPGTPKLRAVTGPVGSIQKGSDRLVKHLHVNSAVPRKVSPHMSPHLSPHLSPRMSPRNSPRLSQSPLSGTFPLLAQTQAGAQALIGLATAPPTSPQVAAFGAARRVSQGGSSGQGSPVLAMSAAAAIASAVSSPRSEFSSWDMMDDVVATPREEHVVDEAAVWALHDRLADRTDGCTVEQLEMVDARCMGAIWRGRELWDRMVLARAVEEALDDVMEDIEWQKSAPFPTNDDSIMVDAGR